MRSRSWTSARLAILAWTQTSGGLRHWVEAWLWTDLDVVSLSAPSSFFGGYALLTNKPLGDWILDRVWLRPEARRLGLMSAIWPEWRERYGNFAVNAPNEAMQAFLMPRGYERSVGDFWRCRDMP